MRLLTLPWRLALVLVEVIAFLLFLSAGAAALVWQLLPERTQRWAHRLARLFQ